MRHLLENLKLPKNAVDWLVMLYESAQAFDDFKDQDKVEQKRLDALIWNTLVSLPQNSFYLIHMQTLWPAVATAILKWQAANTAEKNGDANAMSFAWRAGFYDIVLLVYALCFGNIKARENAHCIMALYGEKFEDYLQEIKRCQIQSA